MRPPVYSSLGLTQAGSASIRPRCWGNGITAAIANAYYPDNRTFFDTTQRMYTQLATDSFSNVMKEFWPDIKRKLTHKGGKEQTGLGD